jgi:tetratricopeptide (TPR) repeat protein
MLCALILLLWGTAGFPQTDAAAEVQSRLDKAYALKIQGNTDAALQIYQSLLPEVRAKGPSQQLTDVLSNLADIADTTGQYDHAVELARETMDVCRRLGDIQCEARSHNDVGLAYLNAGKYEEAAADLEEALSLSSRTGDALTSVTVLNNLGNVYYYRAVAKGDCTCAGESGDSVPSPGRWA